MKIKHYSQDYLQISNQLKALGYDVRQYTQGNDCIDKSICFTEVSKAVSYADENDVSIFYVDTKYAEVYAGFSQKLIDDMKYKPGRLSANRCKIAV